MPPPPSTIGVGVKAGILNGVAVTTAGPPPPGPITIGVMVISGMRMDVAVMVAIPLLPVVGCT